MKIEGNIQSVKVDAHNNTYEVTYDKEIIVMFSSDNVTDEVISFIQDTRRTVINVSSAVRIYS